MLLLLTLHSCSKIATVHAAADACVQDSPVTINVRVSSKMLVLERHFIRLHKVRYIIGSVWSDDSDNNVIKIQFENEMRMNIN